MPRRRAAGLAVLSGLLLLAALGNFTIRWGRENGYFTTWSPHERTLVFLVGAIVAVTLFAAFSVLHRGLDRRGLRWTSNSLGALSTLAAILVTVFVLLAAFGGLRTAVLSAGLVAFGITLALQRPILAIAGWAVIRFGRLFREGDRIEANGIVGDVLDIRLFTTRIWEIGSQKGPLSWGGSVAPLRLTGRVVSVNNAVFLEQPIAVPLGHEPYVFDEFVVRIAYGTDWRFAREVLRSIAEQVVDPRAYEAAEGEYRRLMHGLPLESNFDDRPRVLTNLEEAWIELRLRYLVDARERSITRTRLAELWQEARERHVERIPLVVDRKADVLDPPVSGEGHSRSS